MLHLQTFNFYKTYLGIDALEFLPAAVVRMHIVLYLKMWFAMVAPAAYMPVLY